MKKTYSSSYQRHLELDAAARRVKDAHGIGDERPVDSSVAIHELAELAHCSVSQARNVWRRQFLPPRKWGGSRKAAQE